MNLTLAAIVIMGGWVVGIVVAGTLMLLRPGGAAIRFAPPGAPASGPSGGREEILLGGGAEVLGNDRGMVRAVQIRPNDGRLLALEVAAGPGLDARAVPADAVLSADGRVVRLAEGATELPDGSAPEAATLRRDMPVRGSDGKRLGLLRLVCFDRVSRRVTALVVAGRGQPSLRILPIERVREVGPNGIITDLPGADWAKLPAFATDWEIKQAFMEQLMADPTLRDVQRSLAIDVEDQVVTLRGYVANQSQAERAAQIIRSVPGVMQVDRKLLTDDDMARAVADALRSDPATRPAELQVIAHHGTVDISGVAPDPATSRKIESVASQVPGVAVIHNMVAVRRPTKATA
jgi:osmotically-inducible protein OsmY